MIILAYGVPGSGKSTLLHDLVRVESQGRLLFVMDHEAGWGPDGIHWRGSPPPDLRVVQGDDELEALFELELSEWPDRGVYVFRNVDAGRVAELAVEIGEVAYVDDELDIIARRKGWEDSALRLIVHQGRHIPNREGEICSLHILGACRRPQNLHTDLTDLADQVFVFRLRGMRTLQRLQADSIIDSEDDWQRIRDLPTFHFLHWPSGSWQSVEPVGPARNKTHT